MMTSTQQVALSCTTLRRVVACALAWLVALLVAVKVSTAQDQPMLLPPPELSGESETIPLVGPEQTRLRPDDGGTLPPSLQPLPETLEFPLDEGGFPGSPLPPIYAEDGYYDGFVAPQKLSPHKNGFFQKLNVSAAWIGSGGIADFGLTEIDTSVSVAVPMPIREWPMLITAAYNPRFIDGPSGPPSSDLPPRLNEVYVDFMWLPTFVHRHTLMLAVAPSYYSDFEANHDNAFRLTGKALWIYDLRPEELQLVAGVLYLNRDNIRLLPAGGLIWCPSDWAKFELIFPKPKLAMRMNVGPGFEDWVFGAAEFGGNTWAIERADGTPDNVTLFDYRLLAGVERRRDGGAGIRLEGGYVFGRTVEYSSGVGNFDPPGSFMVRAGVTF